MKIRNWRAFRSGGYMTVEGNDVETGEDVKVTRIDEITPGPNHCVATCSDKATHELLLG
jgi:hypothetical protein